jgi:hypothetical protein
MERNRYPRAIRLLEKLNTYNFTMSDVTGNLSWNETGIFLDPGPFGGGDNNTTVAVLGLTGTQCATFSHSGLNWTTMSPAQVADGQIIVLKTDRPKTLGELLVFLTIPPFGEFGVNLP